MCALSTLPKGTTPLTEPSCGQYSPVLAYHKIGSQSSVNFIMACQCMGAARGRGVLGVVRCGTRPWSRVRARTPPVQHLLRGGYKRDLHAFQGGQRHHGRFDAPEEENGGRGGVDRNNRRRASHGDVALGHVLGLRCRNRLAIVVVCAAFSVTVSEAKTEIMCLRTKGTGVHRRIQRRGSEPGIQPNERVCIPRRQR